MLRQLVAVGITPMPPCRECRKQGLVQDPEGRTESGKRARTGLGEVIMRNVYNVIRLQMNDWLKGRCIQVFIYIVCVWARLSTTYERRAQTAS